MSRQIMKVEDLGKKQMNRADVKKAGFEAISRSQRRLICNLQSTRKSVGKTRFAFTAPKPIGYISVEIGGEEGAADEFIPAGAESFDGIQIARIHMGAPEYPDPANFNTSTKDGAKDYDAAVSAAVQNVAEPAYASFFAAYETSLANMRTTVIDTGTDLYQLARLANFGRLEKIPQLAYAQVKREFAKMVDDAFQVPGHNLIWIHHLKEKGEVTAAGKWQQNGEYGLDGCSTVLDKVQANIEFWREDLTEDDPETGMRVRFNCSIVDSRHSPLAMGKQFQTLDISFADVAMTILSGTKREDWQ